MNRMKGFALIELMIAMVLGLVLLGGVGSIFVANRQAFRTNENLARVQENARTAFELMAREIRSAGGNPCGTPWVANVLSSPTTWWKDWAAGSLIGYDGDQATAWKAFGTADAERVSGTDAIVIKSGSLREGMVIVSHAPASEQFVVNRAPGVDVNDPLMACDGTSAAIFAVTASDPVNRTINYADGLQLGFPTGSSKTFTSGGAITPYSATFWYIGNNDRGGRSLYRMDTANTTEIAEGVTDMQLEFLTRNTATQALATSYRTIAALSAAGILDWTDAAANQVVAVRMTLDLESGESVGTNQAPLARQIIHVVSLRNRESVP